MENKKKAGIIVLSAFNGMSTGHQALKNLGVPVLKYYSSEIKPAALKITAHHFPDTIELGDIQNWETWDIDWSEIDLFLSGSPCQDLSVAGKRRGLKGEKSSFFWYAVAIKNRIDEERKKKGKSPVKFLQENVGSASRKDVGIMSRALGVYPCRINSSLVTAQLRDRYYWTNIKTRKEGFFEEVTADIPPPEDRKIYFQSIVESGFVPTRKSFAIMEKHKDQYTNGVNPIERHKKSIFNLVFDEQKKARAVCESHVRFYDFSKRDEYEKKYIKRLLSGSQVSPAVLDGLRIRPLSKTEYCRLQGFPDDFCDILTANEAVSVLGDGWTLPVIEHIFSFYEWQED